MVSVRITAAGAVAVAWLSFLTAPVSACDERYIKKCERASAAIAAAGEQAAPPTAKRKSAGRVRMVVSLRSKRIRFVKRTHAPGFSVKQERGVTLASAESRMTLPSESALARRFRGFIDPQPLAQNAFEILRKPHMVAVNLEAPMALPPAEAPVTPAVAEEPAAVAPTVSVITTAKQDRIAPKAAAMELTSAESKPVTLPEAPAPAKQFAFAVANAAAAPAGPQAFVSETPPLAPTAPQPNRFSVHQLVLALCGALGAASALRFIVGA